MNLDHSVYPDLDEPPSELLTPGDKADDHMRICGAWDFSVGRTLAIRHSAVYHAFRWLFGWPPVAGVQTAHYRFDDDDSVV